MRKWKIEKSRCICFAHFTPLSLVLFTFRSFFAKSNCLSRFHFVHYNIRYINFFLWFEYYYSLFDFTRSELELNECGSTRSEGGIKEGINEIEYKRGGVMGSASPQKCGLKVEMELQLKVEPGERTTHET